MATPKRRARKSSFDNLSSIPTDMRKGFDGLQGLVSGTLCQDPFPVRAIVIQHDSQ